MLVTRSSGRPFQSTLSVRRATLTVENLANGIVISIHALREESDFTGPPVPHRCRISIHALREESDWSRSHSNGVSLHFNPRSP